MIIKDTEKIAEELKHAKTPDETIRVIENYFSDQWGQLDNDPQKILDDVRETVSVFCDRSIVTAIRLLKSGSGAGDIVIKKDGYISFDIDKMIDIALGLVDDHRIFFNHERDDEIDQIVRETVEKNSDLRFEVTTDQNTGEIFFLAKYPSDLISPIDKVSWKAFDGTLNAGQKTRVEVIKKTKYHPAYYAEVALTNLSELDNMDIDGIRGLAPFDREVHDAIITLFVAGNVFFTVNMIYQTMTGKRDSHCSQNWSESIWKSITKLRHIDMYIDASNEALKDKRITSPRFGSRSIGVPLIDALPTKEIINGKLTRGIALRSAPILYQYSSQKNQIVRFEMKLLDTPVKNKTTETIVIEGFLRRKIKFIVSERKISKNNIDSYRIIKYEDVYSLIDFSECTSRASIDNKKSKIKRHIKDTLDYFIKQNIDNSITGYEEAYTEGKKRPYGVRILFKSEEETP